jgi:hypothetical protein
MEFIEFVRCQQRRSNETDVKTPELVTSDWYYNSTANERKMWTQHFVYFSKHKDLYTIYRYTRGKTLCAHWQEKGEHFSGKSRGRDYPLIQTGDITMTFPTLVKKYDWGANRVDRAAMDYSRVVVMSAALGYPLGRFKAFVGSLRRVYSGDVWLLISKGTGKDIREYLKSQNVKIVESDEFPEKRPAAYHSTQWASINRSRFNFFESVCNATSYSLCLTTDFRDSLFQSDPFRNIDASETKLDAPPVLYLYEHIGDYNNWHYNEMKKPECGLYNDYAKYVNGTKIINGGSMIGSPAMYQQLVKYMRDEWKECNDQVTLNVLVRANVMEGEVKVHPQGQGAMNMVGYGGKTVFDSKDNYLNLNCILAPVVHQYTVFH